MTTMKKITTRVELLQLKTELGVRDDWHEPDEQDVTAEVRGVSFDNAGFWPAEERPYAAPEVIEQHVVLYRDGAPVAAVNLATLFAWATGHEADGDAVPFADLAGVLNAAGIEYPLGLRGVRALVDLRDTYRRESEEAERCAAAPREAVFTALLEFADAARVQARSRGEYETLLGETFAAAIETAVREVRRPPT